MTDTTTDSFAPTAEGSNRRDGASGAGSSYAADQPMSILDPELHARHATRGRLKRAKRVMDEAYQQYMRAADEYRQARLAQAAAERAWADKNVKTVLPAAGRAKARKPRKTRDPITEAARLLGDMTPEALQAALSKLEANIGGDA